MHKVHINDHPLIVLALKLTPGHFSMKIYFWFEVNGLMIHISELFINRLFILAAFRSYALLISRTHFI